MVSASTSPPALAMPWVEHLDQRDRECGERNARMCARLGWDMNIHQLRHYLVPLVSDNWGDLISPVHQTATTHNPYQRIAAGLRGSINSGVLCPGDRLPTVKELAGRYGVAFGTAQRAWPN
jgi:hypothetical protein